MILPRYDLYNRSKIGELEHVTSAYKLLTFQNDILRFDKLVDSEIYVRQESARIAVYGAICAAEIRPHFVHHDFMNEGIGRKQLLFSLCLE